MGGNRWHEDIFQKIRLVKIRIDYSRQLCEGVSKRVWRPNDKKKKKHNETKTKNRLALFPNTHVACCDSECLLKVEAPARGERAQLSLDITKSISLIAPFEARVELWWGIENGPKDCQSAVAAASAQRARVGRQRLHLCCSGW